MVLHDHIYDKFYLSTVHMTVKEIVSVILGVSLKALLKRSLLRSKSFVVLSLQYFSTDSMTSKRLVSFPRTAWL